jgi:hypothetical protein
MNSNNEQKNVPKITHEDIDRVISATEYYQLPGATLTICFLTLKNGFIVTGESACASIENFDEVIGRKIAYENAWSKIWELEGYLLRQRLFEAK